jgi:outer membrane receptor for ferrienterochelin and colicin
MNHTITLKIAGITEEVTVSTPTSVEDTRGNSLSTTLQEEEIEALPDDPEELQAALEAMAGPGGATFLMNGFTGGRLPTRDQIRMIRFRNNSFSADNHDAGRTQIDIITRPNTEWRGNANVNLRGDALNARQPQARVETPQQDTQFQFGVRGPLVANRTSFNFNANGATGYRSEPIIARDVNGTPLDQEARATTDQRSFRLGMEHSLSANQSLFVQYDRSQNDGRGQGVGGFNLPERASASSRESNQLRFRVQGLVGKAALNEVRVQLNRNNNENWSVSPAQTIIVQDYFNEGGAGVNSRSNTDAFEIADNFDFNVGTRHQMRVGLLVEGDNFSNFDERNKAGTFTFTTLENYIAGLPAQYSERRGTLDTSFDQYQLGFYWQDDIRLHRNLSLSVGLRNELQSRIGDKLNLMPRLGFTLAPWGSQTTAIRGGYGLFHDWYESNLYDQTLRVDGQRQQDILILFPGYPDPYAGGTETVVLPSSVIVASPDLKMPQVHQASVGVSHRLSETLEVQASYQMLRGRNQMRSININAPIDGVRPDPTKGNVTQFESTGRSENDQLQLQTMFRVPSRQMFMRLSYTLGQSKNQADGATSLPSNSLDPNADWGPSRQDIRHRVQAMAQVPVVLGIRTSVQFNLQSGVPYNMTTGRDDNRDGVFNDRPEGVTRNSLRGDPTWNLSLNVNRRFTIGGAPNAVAGGPAGGPGASALFAQGPGGGGGGGRGGGGFGGGRGGRDGNNNTSRYSVELFANAQNVLNRVNRTGYTGNRLSPFFGEATGVGRPREINIGLRFNF